MTTATSKPASMNEANERDPYQQQQLRHAGRFGVQAGHAADPRRRRFQRADHPQLRRGHGRKGAAGRSVRGPLADSRGHRDAPRFQLHRSGYPGVHPQQLHRLHGLRDALPRYGDPRQSDQRKRVREEDGRRSPTRPSARCSATSGPRPASTTKVRPRSRAKGGCSRSSSTPASARAAPSASPSATTCALKMIPKTEQVMTTVRKSHRFFKEFGPSDKRYVSDNLLIDMMLQGEDAHLYRRGRLVRRLRRRDRPADDVRRHRGQVRRPVGHHRGHRLQHGLYLDLSVQPVPGAVDELAVRERPGDGDGRALAVGPDGLARPAALVPRRRRGDVRHRLPVALAACSPAA